MPTALFSTALSSSGAGRALCQLNPREKDACPALAAAAPLFFLLFPLFPPPQNGTGEVKDTLLAAVHCPHFRWHRAGNPAVASPEGHSMQRGGKVFRAYLLTTGLSSFSELHTQNLRDSRASRLGQSMLMLPGALGAWKVLCLRRQWVCPKSFYLYAPTGASFTWRGTTRAPQGEAVSGVGLSTRGKGDATIIHPAERGEERWGGMGTGAGGTCSAQEPPCLVPAARIAA